MKIINYILTIISFTFLVSCSTSKVLFEKENVIIIDNKSHYKIIVDYNNTSDFKRTGELLGEGCLEVLPDYEFLLDSYLADIFPGRNYKKYIKEAQILKESLHSKYLLELEGFSSNFSLTENIPDDGKLSLDEILLFNFTAELLPRGVGCSFVGINKELSDTGDTQLSRNLEWAPGDDFQLSKFNAITQIKNPGIDIVSIGYVGYLGVSTGLNDKKVFVGILDSIMYRSLQSKGKTPYVFQLREALESAESIEDIVRSMGGETAYKVNHNIAISDPNRSVILENYTRGKLDGGLKSSVRTKDSQLNPGIEWDIPDSIVAVNAFLLDGNPDNYSKNPHNYIRFNSMASYLEQKKGKVGIKDLKKISTTVNYNESRGNEGSIYLGEGTMQIVLLRPETSEAKIYFRPKNSKKWIKKPKFEDILLFDDYY